MWTGGVYLEGNLSGVGQFITLEQPPGCVLEHGEGDAVDEVQQALGEALVRRCPLNGFVKHNAERLGGETEKDADGLCVLLSITWTVVISEANSDALSLESKTKRSPLPSSVAQRLQEAGEQV